MLHLFSLGGVLFALWLLLSGHFNPLLLGLGVASCALVLALVHRMDVVDREGHPVHLSWRAIGFWIWLLKEIVVSNLQTAWLILFNPGDVRPHTIRITASQKTPVGKVLYANAITLTPGTVTMAMDGDQMDIHCLAPVFAEGLETGEMDRRATAVEATP